MPPPSSSFPATNAATLENPDNVVIVPKTGDIFLQEDSPGEQFVRGVTRDGEIYNFGNVSGCGKKCDCHCFMVPAANAGQPHASQQQETVTVTVPVRRVRTRKKRDCHRFMVPVGERGAAPRQSASAASRV